MNVPTSSMLQNPLNLLPEALLTGGAVTGLLVGSWLPRRRQWIVAAWAGAVCAAAVGAAAVAAVDGGPSAVFGGQYALDTANATARVLIPAGGLLVVALALRPFRAHPRETEFFAFVQLALAGAVMLAGAQDLLLLFASYLLASIPAYTLAGFAKDTAGTEAALKYFVLGAFLGVALLVGITLLYAAGGSTGYPMLEQRLPGAPGPLVAAGTVAVLGGLLFKAGAVPGHFWLPDVLQGSTPPAAALLATLPKIGALVALLRLGAVPLVHAPLPWEALIAVFAAASMTLGNLAAFFQDDVVRLLAYSTISQVGYLLLPVVVATRSVHAQPALLFYLAAYTVTNIGAFAVVCALPQARTLADYRGLARRRPWLAASLAVCLLGLLGTPPTAIFIGKLEVFTAAVDGGYTWLAVLAAINTVVSLFYYLRWIAPVFARPVPGDDDHDVVAAGAGAGVSTAAGAAADAPLTGRFEPVAAAVAYAAAVVSVVLGLCAGPVLAILNGALSR